MESQDQEWLDNMPQSMIDKTVAVKCEGADLIDIDDMIILQGDLKELTQEMYNRAFRLIVTKGFIAPFFLWNDGGIYKILDGTQRKIVLTDMRNDGWKIPPLPVAWIHADSLADAKEKLLAITSAFGKITDDGLYKFSQDIPDFSGMLSDFKLPDFDISAFAGSYFADPEPSNSENDDTIPEVTTPVTKLGDLWILGNHRVYCGDSTDRECVEYLMDGCVPDLIHTDPPYGMNAVSKSGVLSKNYGKDILGDDNPDVAKECFTLIHGMYPDTKQIWWGANYYCSVLPDSECWLVWDKNNGESDQTDCELAWANFRSVVRQFTQSSEKINRVHPTQKPVSLVEWIIKRFKMTSETIADFFGGSGSTLIAAEKNGITGYIMELDTHFCDVIVQRWQDYTDKKATLESTGKTYDEIKSATNPI